MLCSFASVATRATQVSIEGGSHDQDDATKNGCSVCMYNSGVWSYFRTDILINMIGVTSAGEGRLIITYVLASA